MELMNYVKAFVLCGFISMLGQLIYDNTKFTPGHITSLFVAIGALLDSFEIYDKLLEFSKIGGSLPITSFGHSLVHAALEKAYASNYLGILTGMFNKTSAGISFSIFAAFVVAILFKPKS